MGQPARTRVRVLRAATSVGGASLDRSWAALHAIYLGGLDAGFVFRTLVAKSATPAEWNTPTRPQAPASAPAFTIADFGDFGAATYARNMDRMCRASLAMWGVAVGDV